MNTKQLDFFEDYFRLGPCSWMDKYGGRIPEGMTFQIFVQTIQEKGLELRFIDREDWTKAESRFLPCYLLSDGAGQYGVFVVDMGRPLREGLFHNLTEAMLLKAKILFIQLAVNPPETYETTPV